MSILPFSRPAQPDEAPVEAEDGHGDPPASIVADVRGLTPARAALARHMAWIESVEGEIAKLVEGKTKLAADIKKAADAKDELESLVDRDAESLVEKVKAGVDWALSQFGGHGVQDLDAKLAASRHHAAVAERALKATGLEIDRLEALLATLRSRKLRFVKAAVREAAAGVVEDFRTATENLRDAMVQLAGLDAALGDPRPGRLVAVVPDLIRSSGLDEMPVLAPPAAISEAAKVWRKFADAVAKDPRASAEMIEFSPVDPKAPDSTCYHELHSAERRVVDFNFDKRG